MCSGSSGEDIIEIEAVIPEVAADSAEGRVPRLAEGTELIGEYQGSGFREPKFILRRADGQIIQVPHLLYLVAGSLDGKRDVAQVATRVSAEVGRTLGAEQVSYLLDQRLRPVGVLAADDGGSGGTAKPRPDPLLSLRFRVAVVPERTAWVIAGIFQSFFLRPVMFAALALFVILDAVIVFQGGYAQVESSALVLVHRPELTLLVLGTLLVSAVFHECGHVAACRYGGARPGNMGFGIYLVWPALYSTVTESYRLGRIGRLRTDLGGVYFNAVFIAGMSVVYCETGAPWLLISIALLHVETMRQFIPFIRLDGYYILSDIIGVPDLFTRMGPVLTSALPGRKPHPRVLELKPWVRRVVTLWVLFVVPALLYFLLPFVILAPRVLPVVWHALLQRGPAVAGAVQDGRMASAVVGSVQMILLVLPWAAGTLILGMMCRRLVRAVRRWSRRRAGAPAGPR